MKVLILFISIFAVALAFRNGNHPRHIRLKRDASGALEIITNSEPPIHAEVKSDGATENGATEKPCPKYINPSSIEAGTVFKVSPPKDVTYEAKSLRKSWPLTSRLDLVRSVTRVFTLAVLVISAVIEFYPLLQHLYYLYYF